MNAGTRFSLSEWLKYLENRYPQEIELGLTRIQKVAEQLQLCDFNHAKIITVAGTNGKGSTVAVLEAIYHAAGYKVGAFTSPHLLKFNERIRVNKQEISDSDLCSIFSFLEIERGEIPLKFFEMITLAALWYFKQQDVDVIILEVGMGGRLDATNIIDADLSIITTVDLDHEQFLGNTREEIAKEKAGILRRGKPFIYADSNPPQSVLIKASELQALTILKDEQYSISVRNNEFTVRFENKTFKHALPPIHINAISAGIVASYILGSSLPIEEDDLIAAMDTVSISGRQQLAQEEGIPILYDVAHNPQSARLLAERLKTLRYNRIHAVFGALKDKNIEELINSLRPYVNFWYPALLDSKRASNEEMLSLAFQKVLNGTFNCYKNPCEAFLKAKAAAEVGDIIVVYGSFLTVSAVMQAHASEEI